MCCCHWLPCVASCYKQPPAPLLPPWWVGKPMCDTKDSLGTGGTTSRPCPAKGPHDVRTWRIRTDAGVVVHCFGHCELSLMLISAVSHSSHVGTGTAHQQSGALPLTLPPYSLSCVALSATAPPLTPRPGTRNTSQTVQRMLCCACCLSLHGLYQLHCATCAMTTSSFQCPATA
jgi:hypothetical protein